MLTIPATPEEIRQGEAELAQRLANLTLWLDLRSQQRAARQRKKRRPTHRGCPTDS